MWYNPPLLSNFFRSKTWWNIIKYSPVDVFKWFTIKHPSVGVTCVILAYYEWWKWPLQQASENRFNRFRENWSLNVHLQENKDWGTKKNRDEMRQFINSQISEHGSFEKAVEAYEKKTGIKAPPLLINDPVFDHTLSRVGIPGVEEVSFLWDGTSYMGQEYKPLTFSDGKIALPEAPTFYTHFHKKHK